jgi:hypothetical protein
MLNKLMRNCDEIETMHTRRDACMPYNSCRSQCADERLLKNKWLGFPLAALLLGARSNMCSCGCLWCYMRASNNFDPICAVDCRVGYYWPQETSIFHHRCHNHQTHPLCQMLIATNRALMFLTRENHTWLTSEDGWPSQQWPAPKAKKPFLRNTVKLYF